MDLKLVRIDSRLIHGQVVTKWVKQTGANEILIIDDGLDIGQQTPLFTASFCK